MKYREHNGQKLEDTKGVISGIFNLWPLCSLFFIDLCLLITPLVSSNFWPLCSLYFIDLCLLITPLVFSNFWPLYCLPVFYLWLLITHLVSSNFIDLYQDVFKLFLMRVNIMSTETSVFDIH
jgi:hypothetical protein